MEGRSLLDSLLARAHVKLRGEVGVRRAARGLLVGMLCGMGAAAPVCSQTPSGVTAEQEKGRALLAQMVTAMGGEKWMHRGTERVEGKSASFYKSAPNPYETQFEEYLRLQPFGERVVIVSKQGVFIPTTKRDVAEVWTPENGYEISYHGRKPLPKPEVEEFERRRMHTLDVVVNDWLKRPDTLVTFEGSTLEDRTLVDRVSVLTAVNDAVTLSLDQETHLPRSRAFEWRDPLYKDFNKDVERYDDWQPTGGVMTPLTITRYRNGDMVSQRFLTKVQYGLPMDPALFDPDRSLSKK